MRRRLLPILLAALLGGGIAATLVLVFASGAGSTRVTLGSAASAGSSTAGTRREVSSSTLTATQIYAKDSAGVVTIKAKSARASDLGTGIVINGKGLILTNDHVIQGAESITVGTGGSASVTRTARVVGEEANQDLALIEVNPAGMGLKPLTLVSSSSVQVGDQVYAIGNPYGLEKTLTKGIVSALSRQISAPDGHAITGTIQTDAALNPGNSGGPLIDEAGQVIGVNSQIASEQASTGGSQPGSTGVGFAISSNTVAAAIEKIESGSGVSYASAAGGSGSPYGESRRLAGEEAEARERERNYREGEGEAASGLVP